MKKLAMLDALFLYMEKGDRKTHVVAYMLYDYPENQDREEYISDLVKQLRITPWLFPNHDMSLTRSWRTLGQWAWIPAPDRDMQYHVRKVQLPGNGGLKALQTYACDVNAEPMDYTKPMWELHVIDGFDNNQFALIMKVHHCCIDGVSGMNLLSTSMSPDPAENYLDRIEKMRNQTVSHTPLHEQGDKILNRRWQKIKNLVSGYITLFRNIRSGDCKILITKTDAPTTEFSGEIEKRKSTGSAVIPLNAVKAVAKTAGVSVNDVVSAVTGTAMVRYLSERGETFDPSLRALMPVSVHTKDDISESNKIGIASYTMATTAQSHLLQLQEIAESTNIVKKQMRELPQQVVMSAMAMSTLPLIASSFLPNYEMPVLSNVVISNVQGPKEPLYLNGALLRSVCPISLIFPTLALNVTVISYADELDIGITADAILSPDIQTLADYMVDAFSEMEVEIIAEKQIA